MKTCTKCGESKPLSEYHANPRNKSGLQSNCKSCQRQSASTWRAANRTRVADYNTQYRADNADAIAAQERAYRNQNRERLQSKEKQRYLRDPIAALLRSKKRKAVARNAQPLWADTNIIVLLYTTRKYMTEETGYDWHVDHVVPLQGGTVCGLHVHNNLRVVPASYNMAKSNKHWPNQWA